MDGKHVRKTETLKNTNHPRWDQELTILVTPMSVVQFRVLDHSSFRKDTVLGEKTVYLRDLLCKQREQRAENYILYMNLTKSSSSASGASSSGETSPDGTRATNSEMLVVIKGLVRMDAMQQGNGMEATSNSGSVVTVNGLGLTPNGGNSGSEVRVRGRMSGGGAVLATESDSVNGAVGGGGGGIVSASSHRHSGMNWSGVQVSYTKFVMIFSICIEILFPRFLCLTR